MQAVNQVSRETSVNKVSCLFGADCCTLKLLLRSQVEVKLNPITHKVNIDAHWESLSI